MAKCSVNDCERASFTRGWCSAHYSRFLRTGDIQEFVPVKLRIVGNDEARFLSKVNKLGPWPGDDTLAAGKSRCWMWTASSVGKRYGEFSWRGRGAKAHGFSYAIYVGPVPSGLVLDHLCRNTFCVNPEHLEAVTQLENMRRGAHARKTHCPQGHPYTPENTKRYLNQRECRTCQNEWARRARAKKRAASCLTEPRKAGR